MKCTVHVLVFMIEIRTYTNSILYPQLIYWLGVSIICPEVLALRVEGSEGGGVIYSKPL